VAGVDSAVAPYRRVLVLAAHTDDEFGCAGTILRLVASAADIQYVALSRCEESVPEGLPRDVLETECRECAARLGLRPENVQVWDFQVRHFPARRQEILERLVRLCRDYGPDLVFVPSSYDNHQDHRTIYEEGLRAFKFSTILGYELPQNTSSFENSAFVALTPEQLAGKVTALGAYRSQSHRTYTSSQFIEGLARVRGVQCNTLFAEAFEVIRLVLR
jgi:N-acetylglucosamine malate deacetylase 1